MFSKSVRKLTIVACYE